MLEDIAYSTYKKKSDIHGTVLYPAVMIAPMQKEVLEILLDDKEIKSIFDPFHGSGTALYEAAKINPNLSLYGCDINPLANLITKVKLQGVDNDILSDIKFLESQINSNTNITPYDFPNIDKWLRPDVKKDIAKIRTAIIKIANTKNRLYFWYMLCDIIRRYSNTRSSTYKLHIKTKTMIDNLKNNLIKDYISSIKDNVEQFKEVSKNYTLTKFNTLELLPALNNNSFDITITSPPYGDNATTVPYGQFSMLALYTIPGNDLDLEGWELNNFNMIDSKSMGGWRTTNTLDEQDKEFILPYLNQISEAKHKKVILFFSDYFKFLKEISRITSKYIVITLGNRTVDGVQIDLSGITQEYLLEQNYQVIKSADRKIAYKRTPSVTSKVNDAPVKSMNKEYITVFKKIK